MIYHPFPAKIEAIRSLRDELRRDRKWYTGNWAKNHLCDRLFSNMHSGKYKNVELGLKLGKWYLVYNRADKHHTGGWRDKKKAIQWFLRNGR